MIIWEILKSQGTSIIFWLFCAVAFIQLFYYLFFFVRLPFYKSKDKFRSQTHAVSVVVCARDEAHNLEINLPDVLSQDYTTSHEVILVNDNSFDDTKFFMEELANIFKHLHPINLSHEAKHIPGKKYPLGIGIKSSKYEVMLLTDADCKPASKWWIQKMQDAYQGNIELVLGYGPYNKKPGLLNKLVRYETFMTGLQYLSYAIAGLPYMGVGRNLSYRKKLFYRVKGFSSINHIPGGDDDLFINKVANKHNTAVVLDPEAFTYSEAPETFKAWWRQKTRHYSTAKYYRPIHKFLLGMYAFAQVSFYPLLIICLIYGDWKKVLAIYAIKLLIQGFVWHKATTKLNEKDLFPWFWLFDMWQMVYYLIYTAAIFKKPGNNWN